MTVLYSAYLTRVIPYARDCADPVAEAAVRDAVIDFCQRTHWLLDPITFVSEADEGVYALTPTDAFTETVAVKEVRFDGVLLTPTTEDVVNASTIHDWRAPSATPRNYIVGSDSTTVRLIYAPDTADLEVQAVLAVAPTRDSTGAADSLFDRWAEDIAMGARARLHEQANAPYYDIKMAEQMRRRFNHAIGRANVVRRQSPAGVPLVMRPPRFF